MSETNAEQGQGSRLTQLDAMRGWASLGVIALHTGHAVCNLSVSANTFLDLGGAGVQLFYILSAFTLLMSFEKRAKTEKSPLRNYFLRRFFRIAPLFYFAILLYCILDGFGPRFWAPHGIDAGTILGSLLLVHGWHPFWINGAVYGGWSVGVEVSFYLVLPWLMSRIHGVQGAWRWFVGCALAGSILSLLLGKLLGSYFGRDLYVWLGFMHFWLPNQLGVFLLGFVLFAWIQHPATGRRAPLSPGFLIATGLLVVAASACFRLPVIAPFIVASLGFLLLLRGLYDRPVKWLVNPATVYLGRISYSLYLTHMASLTLVVWAGIPKYFFSLGFDGLSHFAVTFPVVAGVSTMTATLT
ncbi:MAG TPA: acyltransferase, partial [Roseimicrobium sp.]|nr:acyltransferase [Roseimicrobium sp.]